LGWCLSSTTPDTGNEGYLDVTVETRKHSSNRFEPHFCGCLLINKGARAVDSSTGDPLLDENSSPLVTNQLFLAALHDKDGDHQIDRTGNGDEDRDGLTDYHECEVGTDPCDKDTDHDGLNDGADPYPLDKNNNPG
jgi:hypothetical protein